MHHWIFCFFVNITRSLFWCRIKHGNCLLFSFFICLFLRYIMVFRCILSVGWFMVFNATFNNISVMSWRSVLIVKETADLSQVTQYCIEYISSWTGFELTTLVVIGTDCTGSCKIQLSYDHDGPCPFGIQMSHNLLH